MATLTLKCSDCENSVSIEIGQPNSFCYGSDQEGQTLETIHFAPIRLPKSWDTRINDVRRCPSCHKTWIAENDPRWKAQAAARAEAERVRLLDLYRNSPEYFWKETKSLAPHQRAWAMEAVLGSIS